MSEQQTPATAEPSFREPTFRETVELVEAEAPAPVEAPEAPHEPPPQDKFVPLGALHEERQKRKNAEAATRQREHDFAEYQRQANERLNYLHQLATQQQPAEPTFEQDPLTGTYKEVQRVGQELAQLRKEQADAKQAEHQQRVVQHFIGTVTSQEQQFATDNPDYYAAVDWAKGKKIHEYIAVGMPEEVAVQRVQQEARQIAIDAISRGENPGEVGYRLARAIGYQPQPNAQDKLAMQKAGTAASTPSANSGRGGGKLSLDALLKMDSADFLKQTEGKNWKKLVGG